MKKRVLMAMLMMLSISFSTVFAAEPDTKNKNNEAVPGTEKKMTSEDYARLTRRVEEIRGMDKSELTAKERKALRKELREIKENVKRDGGYIYIGAGTLLVIILLVILLV